MVRRTSSVENCQSRFVMRTRSPLIGFAIANAACEMRSLPCSARYVFSSGTMPLYSSQRRTAVWRSTPGAVSSASLAWVAPMSASRRGPSA